MALTSKQDIAQEVGQVHRLAARLSMIQAHQRGQAVELAAGADNGAVNLALNLALVLAPNPTRRCFRLRFLIAPNPKRRLSPDFHQV